MPQQHDVSTSRDFERFIDSAEVGPACLPAFSRPRYEGWPHHEQAFSIDVCLPPSLLVLAVTTQSTILCCLSMSSWVYLENGSLGLYLVLIPSPGSPLSFSIYAHSMPVSFLSQTQVDFLTPPAVTNTHSLVLLAVHDTLKTCLAKTLHRTGCI